MNSLTFMVHTDGGGGYYSQAVSYSIYTQADNIKELNHNIAEAIECHFYGPAFPEFKLIFATHL